MSDPVTCGGGFTCDLGDDDDTVYVCRLYWEGPNQGITNFDNIGLGRSIFKLVVVR